MIAVSYFCRKNLANLRKKIEKRTVSFYTNNFLSTTITPYLINNLEVCVFLSHFIIN